MIDVNSSIVAFVILYNPDVDYVVSNLKQLKKCGLDILVYDNTEVDYDRSKLEAVSDGFYYQNSNEGLSKAFNVMILDSIDKYDFFAFFDQDSIIDSTGFKKLFENFFLFGEAYKIGIIAAQPVMDKNNSYRNSEIKKIKDDLIEVEFVPSSYSIIKKELVNNIGLFQEDFFIDFIDYDYSLRAREAGFSILVDTSVKFEHNIGDGSIFLFGKYLSPITSPFRHYYQIRNSLTSHKRRGAGFSSYIKTIIRRFISVTINSIYNIKSAPARYYYLFKGIVDFFLGNMGKL